MRVIKILPHVYLEIHLSEEILHLSLQARKYSFTSNRRYYFRTPFLVAAKQQMKATGGEKKNRTEKA